MAKKILLRIDTTSNWSSNNPILLEGEIGYDSSNEILKIGDGSTVWNDLKYLHEDLFQPIGSVIAWSPGYFDDGSPPPPVYTSSNLILTDNWKECDGSECNDSDSPIFNGVNRFLPNLTEDRFLMGGTLSTIGDNDSNDMIDHTHNCTGQSVNHNHYISGGSHTHIIWEKENILSGGSTRRIDYGSYNSGSTCYTAHSHTCHEDATHTHVIGSGNPVTSTDNKPQFLSCKYIMRIK